MIDHFNDLKEKGDLDLPWEEQEAKKAGMDDLDIGMFSEFGILKDVVK